ncbi:hypothetical protein C493_16781 [Natronolimnohabitans innermongolicus JCM 12255]|uniref:SSD domain-containing protein n=2 Tax=Natronolimnohabitans innermongolicus TaxID=253107 RepID=L9WRF1_9EURY|nr:hypothetical protein C493_16781 [Natronolimnohabitans innermongolicus JCM 12255]
MPMLDDDSSLDQFETDSDAAEALEDIDERFVVDDDENTTSVQLIVRGEDENVLTQESLLNSLELQQEIRANESVNSTLVEDDAITGVENIVAITAVTNEQVADLEAQGAELEERGAEIEQRGAELEEDGAELEQREEELETRTATLEEGLDESLALQRQGATEAEIDATIEETAAAAELDDEQAAEYGELVGQALEIDAQLAALEEELDDPEADDEYQALSEELEQVSEGATVGIFEAEFTQLEEDAAELEEREEELEDDQQVLEADQEALEEQQTELEEGDDQPSLDEQIETLEALGDDEFEEVLTDTLTEGENGDAPALNFMPSDYEPGSTEAETRMTMVTQQMDGEDMMGGELDDTLESQLDLRDIANAQDDGQEYVLFGIGVITEEIENSMDDSLAIVGPLALLFVVIALSVAYRDPLDIALGVVGIIGVLIWTFGFMGWAGIAFNQMMIAVPVLLIGLSIDYAIHVFMRHREQREADGVTSTVRGSMSIALAGVGVALVWVTATTAIGFLSNLVSPIGPIREFGVVSSVGIIAALIIFGGLIPALKIEIDSVLESRGWSRRKRAFGTGEGRFTSLLTVGSTAARRIPLVIIVAALLLTAGGVYGATQVDTSFEEEDFLAESPPAWTEYLPGGMAPGEYQAADNLEFVNENFQREDTQTQILVEGDITDDSTLQQLSDAQDEAAEKDVVYTLPNGEADVEGPLSVMEETAAENESFNETYQASLNDDGVPTQNIQQLYDELFEANEQGASAVIDRTDDGEYEAILLTVGIQGGAEFDDTTTEVREIAGLIDASGTGDERNLDAGDGELNAIATGDPIVNHIVEQDLLDTVLTSLMVTLVAVFAFLTAAYWLTGNSATLGTVTLLPVAFAVSWILGTMYLLDMPFNVLTGMITSLTIGLGVAYSIHVSARYSLELERQGNAWSAMRTTVTGTGGALLGSAATTVGGFGTLAFAILPALQQFGIITGLTITYSFLASVVVLPTLLILWTRYFGPDVSFDTSGVTSGTPTADGGVATETDMGSDERESDGGNE